MPPLQTKKNTQTKEKRLRVFMWPGGVKTPPYKSYFQGAVGVGVPDDPLPVYHSAKLTPSSTAFTSTSPS